MKHYKLVQFLSNLNVKPPLHERKAPHTNTKSPYWRRPGDGSGFSVSKRLFRLGKRSFTWEVCTKVRLWRCREAADAGLSMTVPGFLLHFIPATNLVDCSTP